MHLGLYKERLDVAQGYLVLADKVIILDDTFTKQRIVDRNDINLGRMQIEIPLRIYSALLDTTNSTVRVSEMTEVGVKATKVFSAGDFVNWEKRLFKSNAYINYVHIKLTKGYSQFIYLMRRGGET